MSGAAARVDVEQKLASLCGVLNASHARLVAIVAGGLADESWAIGGVRSPEHWLTMRAGLSPFRARQVVAVARRFGELPQVMGEFAAGQLSLDQVAVVARYAPAHVEASVAELAVNASVPQLRRSLSHYCFDPPAPHGLDLPDPSGDHASGDSVPDQDKVGGPLTWNGYALVEDRAGAPAQLSTCIDQGGRFTLRFSAPADLGALVEAALLEAKDALFTAGRPQVSMGDAMVEIARRSLGAVASVDRRDAYGTYVHVDTEGGWLSGRPRLPAHLVAKLTCHGVLQPLWHTQGAPVNVGRAQRIVPARNRRLVHDRDRGCRFPGCAATAYVECHHLILWADGGATDTFNLACLCPFHHDGHHDGQFTVTGDADDPGGLAFTTRAGHPIGPGPTYTTPQQPSGSPPTTTPPTTTYRGPSGDTLNLRRVTFHEPREPALN